MDRLLRLGPAGLGMDQGSPSSDGPVVDTAEQVYISSLALLKMLKHGRAGVPMEVMGLMLGEFVDDYTVRVIDVFAMPQSGTVSKVPIAGPVVFLLLPTNQMVILRSFNLRVLALKLLIQYFKLRCWICLSKQAVQKWLSAGITLILVLVAGSQVLISILSRVSKRYLREPSQLSSIRFRVSREKW